LTLLSRWQEQTAPNCTVNA
jgi:hypothetical protein